jgi:hypothetical protein
MSRNGGESGGKGAGAKLIGALATAGTVFLARKLATVAWTRATGKVPPTDPADPAVRLGEAAAWAVVVGITVEMARLFASRATTRRLHTSPEVVEAVQATESR